jgi:predicted enzyme related to lactoylglutathione lyase
MINGAHIVIQSKDVEADKAFFKDVLKFGHVDVGNGRLFFRLPDSELGLHESEKNDSHELFLMCDDLDAEITRLTAAGIACDPPSDQGWGIVTRLQLPGGGSLALYQPRHARP